MQTRCNIYSTKYGSFNTKERWPVSDVLKTYSSHLPRMIISLWKKLSLARNLPAFVWDIWDGLQLLSLKQNFLIKHPQSASGLLVRDSSNSQAHPDLAHAPNPTFLLDVVVSTVVVNGSAQELRSDARRAGRGHRADPICHSGPDTLLR